MDIERRNRIVLSLAGGAALAFTAGCAAPVPPGKAPVPSQKRLPDIIPAPAERPAPVPVALVHATTSASTDEERSYSKTLTTRMAGWLNDIGIPCAVMDDDAVSRGAARSARVVLLCYNPTLSAGELTALRQFLEGGGRLIVFNSADSRLAALMDMRLGACIAATRPGQWSAFRFRTDAPPGAPARVLQDGRTIRPVYPASAAARVVAQWEDAGGVLLAEPAWVQSERGLWMSYVLLEGDVPAKKQMLLAMAALYEPALWPAAAEHAVRSCGQVGRFRGTADAVDRITSLAAPGRGDGCVQALLTQAERLQTQLVKDYRLGQYTRVVQAAGMLDAALIEAYARTQTPRPGEFRGVWNHSGTGLYPGDWNRTCRLLAQCGMTAVFPNVARPGSAHYPSRVTPRSEVFTLCGDQVAQCIAAARRHGLQVHAWKLCWTLDGAPEDLIRSLRRQGRLQVSASGEQLNWLCPSHPANLALELDSIRELVRGYALDGVHLDYVRYKSSEYCFCAGCRQRFSRDTGLRVRRWPADVRTGRLAAAYRQWRRDQITRLVMLARAELRKARPNAKLSAAVFNSYPQCRDSIGQDWGEWLKKGYVEFVCPMDYTGDLAAFGGLVGGHLGLPGAQGRIYPGIGVTSSQSRLNAVQTIDQILTVRRLNGAGFVLFDLNNTLEKEILPMLGMGLTSAAAP